MVMVASLAATFYAYWQAGRRGMSQVVVLDISLVSTLTGIIGARLFHIFAEAPGYYWAHPSYVFHFWQGGFVGYGAFIGVAAGIIGYLKFKKLPVLKYCDLMALGCPLIIFFVRIGCLGAGCCYGKPTTSLFHLIFTNPASDAGEDFPGVPLYPTQIYDMISALVIFGLIHLIDRKKKFDGVTTLAFFALYAFFRFFIEFFRGDADRGLYFNGLVSTSQITGVVILVVCSALYFRLKQSSRS